MATFERTSPFDRNTREITESDEPAASGPASEAWRKCWVCGVRVYLARDRAPSDMAPSDVWVKADFADGVLVRCALFRSLSWDYC